MRWKIALLVVALVLGGFAAAAAVSYLDSARTDIVAEGEPIEVLVAQQSLPKGMSAEELIERELIMIEEVPRQFVSADAVSSERVIEGQVLADPLAEGEQVMRARFQYPSQAGLSYTIPDGYVAVSIPNSAVKGVSGLVRPGDHVMILVTFAPGPDSTEPLTRVLLEKVRVLATGSRITSEYETSDEDDDSGSALSASRSSSSSNEEIPGTITLALPPVDVERIVFAEENGSVWLALHATAGADVPITQGQTLQTVFE